MNGKGQTWESKGASHQSWIIWRTRNSWGAEGSDLVVRFLSDNGHEQAEKTKHEV
jgi:hypothetical protein